MYLFQRYILILFFRRLEVIDKERSPQILAIHHGGEDETDEDEGEGFVGMRTNSTDEDRGEEEHCDRLDTSSLDSSFHSLSPGEFSLNASDYESVIYFFDSDWTKTNKLSNDNAFLLLLTDLRHQEGLSPNMARLALSSDTTPSHSPPHCVAATPTNKKLSQIRARRLHLSSEHSPVVSRQRCVRQTSAAETDLSSERVQQSARTNLPPRTPIPQIPHPPSTRALLGGPVNSWYENNTWYFNVIF